MIRLMDKTRIAEITMQIWNGNGYDPDWSNDFYSVGSLPYNPKHDAYIVDDVQYCVEQAEDWRLNRGDFYDPDTSPEELENRTVFADVKPRNDKDLFEMAVQDWLADHADEMSDLELTGSPVVDEDDGDWAQYAEDEKHTYVLRCDWDGDVYIVCIGTK